MNGINKVILVGNAGKDADMRYTTSGRGVASFSIATNRMFTPKNGERRKETEWHRVVAFGRLGEIAGQLVVKGSAVYVEGRIHTNEWTDNQGVVRKSTEIWADTLQILGRKRGQAPLDMPSPVIVQGEDSEAEIPF